MGPELRGCLKIGPGYKFEVSRMGLKLKGRSQDGAGVQVQGGLKVGLELQGSRFEVSR